MREPAEWMQPTDDRILELIREYGNLTPVAVADYADVSRQYASARCAKLTEYGLLTRIHRGLYGLTEAGRAYLDEELDASTLAPEDGDESDN